MNVNLDYYGAVELDGLLSIPKEWWENNGDEIIQLSLEEALVKFPLETTKIRARKLLGFYSDQPIGAKLK